MQQRLAAMINLAVEVWAQKLCLLTGHDGVREHGTGEVFERCQRCGRRSAGWQWTTAAPVRKFDGDPARHQLVVEATIPWVALPFADVAPEIVITSLDELVGDLYAAGRLDDVQLLLMPTDGRQH